MHSASLPLLEGLYGRPEALEETVKEALARFEAARKIARWTSSCFRLEASTSYHQKHKKRKLEYKKKKQKQKIHRMLALHKQCVEHNKNLHDGNALKSH